jgi:tetratricopeptide (TPR) repeat protein
MTMLTAGRVACLLAVGVVLLAPGAASRPKRGAGLRHKNASARPAPVEVAAAIDPGASAAVRIFQSSYEHEAAGRYREALAALETLPAERRATYLVTLRRAWLLHLAGKEADSWAGYAKARELEASSVEAQVGAMLPAMALGRWADVQTLAKGALAIEPGNYLASLRLAFATFNLGRFAEAEALYRKLLARYPSDPDVRAGLAWCFAKQGRLGEARREFLQALASAPRSATIASGLRAVAAATP